MTTWMVSRYHQRHHQSEAEMNQHRDAVHQRRLTLPVVSFVIYPCFYHHLRMGVGVSYSSNVLPDVTNLQTPVQYLFNVWQNGRRNQIHQQKIQQQKNLDSAHTPWTLKFFLNGTELLSHSVNLGNLVKHWSMNWCQFKDLVSHMCLASVVVASWYLA